MRGICLVFGFSLLLLVSFLGEANNAANLQNDEIHIVYMGAAPCSTSGAQTSDHHAQLLTELMKRKQHVAHIYNNGFFGFAARLSKEEAESIKAAPGVVSVFPDRILKLHSTRSWDFLETQANAKSEFGSKMPATAPSVSNLPSTYDTIIGIIDSGIWPESPSFSDKDMGPIPPRWNGTCMTGNDSNSFTCNKKIIGARYYLDPKNQSAVLTPRDGDGHGTHMASIAAGLLVPNASYYGLANGIARGGMPAARIAVYTVCRADGGCPMSNILKAIDDAIADGVDVLAVATGFQVLGEPDFDVDPVSLGAFHAMQNNITVVCSAGNDGPSLKTVENIFPWALTVAATTIDRRFEATIFLQGHDIKGGGINVPTTKPAVYPLVDGRSVANQNSSAYNASNCIKGSLDGDKVKNKIVLCENKDENHKTQEKFDMLKRQGAIGMIMIDNEQSELPWNNGTSLIAIVSEGDGKQIRTYINSTSNASVTISQSQVLLNVKPAPVVPFFSPRGPSDTVLNLLKPDVVAPGVNILGAWPSNDPGNKGLPSFNILSGTSMSCAHVTGLAAMVKSVHPTWSPSAIKSAIMTTAIQTNNLHVAITTYNGSRATPYDIGAGEINPSGALSPGLVYETETNDYFNFLCNFGYKASKIKKMSRTTDRFFCPNSSKADYITDMNYPSIAVTKLKANGVRTVNRTVTNVGEKLSTYTATVEPLTGVEVEVVPKKLEFTENVKKVTFQVIFKPTAAFRKMTYGSLTWGNGKYNVRSPIVVS